MQGRYIILRNNITKKAGVLNDSCFFIDDDIIMGDLEKGRDLALSFMYNNHY
jgi:hypothetical protein